MLSSVPDAAGMVFRWGFARVFGDGYRPFIRSLAGVSQGFSRAKSQYRAMMIGAEMTLMTRSRSINDIREDFRPGSKFERAMQVIGESSQVVNLNAPCTDMMKGIA